MPFARIITGITLLGFLFTTFHWEVDQVMMWQQMIRDSGEEIGLLRAANQALSGNSPCSGCKSLSRQHVSERDSDSLSSGDHHTVERLL